MSQHPSSDSRSIADHVEIVVVADDSGEVRTMSMAEFKEHMRSGDVGSAEHVGSKSTVSEILASMGDIMGRTYFDSIREVVSKSATQSLSADWQRIGDDVRRALANSFPDEHAKL